MKLLKLLAISTQLLFSLEAQAEHLDLTILTVPLAGVSSANPKTATPPALYLDALYQLIERNYAGNITYKETSPNRIIKDLTSTEKAQCLINVKNKMFDSFLVFIPVTAAINPRFIYDPEKLKAIPKINNMVDIEKIITEKKYVGGIVKGRPYSDDLAPYIEKGIANQTIHEINSSTFGTNLVGMLASERIDYIIEYPTTLYAYTGPAKNLKLNEAVIYQGRNINEIGFYCSKNATSTSVSEQINKAILKTLQNDLDSYLKITTGFDVGPQQQDLQQKVNEYIIKKLQ